MLITLNEAKARLSSSLSTEEVINVTAGLSRSLATTTNRVFGDLAESVTADGCSAVLKVYRHGFRPGDVVSVMTDRGGTALDLDEATVITNNWSVDTFSIDAKVSPFDTTYGSVYVVPVRTDIMRTQAVENVYLPYKPLKKVLSVELRISNGQWLLLDSDEYEIVDLRGGVSNTGEIELIDRRWPDGKGERRFNPQGARIKYISGAPASDQILYALRGLVKASTERGKAVPLQSESYDYYSYSRLGAEQLGKLFGEFDRILLEEKLAV